MHRPSPPPWPEGPPSLPPPLPPLPPHIPPYPPGGAVPPAPPTPYPPRPGMPARPPRAPVPPAPNHAGIHKEAIDELNMAVKVKAQALQESMAQVTTMQVRTWDGGVSLFFFPLFK